MTRRDTSSGGRGVGTALIIAGVVILTLSVLWRVSLLVQGIATVGGSVFFLLFVALFAVPLMVGGWYLRGRGAQEAAESAVFSERRAVLDADAALRRQVVRELEQQLADVRAALPALPAPAAADAERALRLLADVRDDLSRPGYSATTWLESAAGLRPDQLATVRRYDDLLAAQTRRAGELAGALRASPDRAASLAETAAQLAEHVREREALLGRASEAAPMRPQEMLAAGVAPRRRVEDPVSLALEDAVSYGRDDYVVRAVLDYFAGGRRWRSYQLHDGRSERWLQVDPGGATLLWLEPVQPPPAAAGDEVIHASVAYAQQDRGSATVSLESAAGRQDGVLVDYRRYRAGEDVLIREEWPDGPRVLAGRPVAREDLDLWTKPPATE